MLVFPTKPLRQAGWIRVMATALLGMAFVRYMYYAVCGLEPLASYNGAYTVLGAHRESAAAEITRSFRQLSRTAHPDKGGHEDPFVLLSEAHSVLKDPTARFIYEKFGPSEVGVWQKDEKTLYEFLSRQILRSSLAWLGALLAVLFAAIVRVPIPVMASILILGTGWAVELHMSLWNVPGPIVPFQWIKLVRGLGFLVLGLVIVWHKPEDRRKRDVLAELLVQIEQAHRYSEQVLKQSTWPIGSDTATVASIQRELARST